MKKLLILSTLFLSVSCWAVPYKSVSNCQFDYDDFNFCSKVNIKKYRSALLSQKVNFSDQYILVNVGNNKGLRFVALDKDTGIAYPLEDEILRFKDSRGRLTGKPPKISYAKDNSEFCIEGSVGAYRNAYDNVRVCYSIQKDTYSKFGKDFLRTDSPESISN